MPQGEEEEEPNLHGESLEETCQFPLGGRICEVSDVESATLGSTGKNCILSSSLVGGRRGLRRGVGNSCLAKSGSNVVDGVSNLLRDGRHDELGGGLGLRV